MQTLYKSMHYIYILYGVCNISCIVLVSLGDNSCSLPETVDTTAPVMYFHFSLSWFTASAIALNLPLSQYPPSPLPSLLVFFPLFPSLCVLLTSPSISPSPSLRFTPCFSFLIFSTSVHLSYFQPFHCPALFLPTIGNHAGRAHTIPIANGTIRTFAGSYLSIRS